MKNYKKIFIILSILLLFPNIVSAYEQHEPILIENVHATADNPYIIEGYEITNPDGNCIEIQNSEHIIIKNNYLYDCGINIKEPDYSQAFSVLVGESSYIIFENNILDNNFRGFMAYNTPHLRVINNKVNDTVESSPLECERCSNSEFAFNYLSDSGDPTHFWVPGDRSIGLTVSRSDNVDIHDNIIIRSTSDGIAVKGHIYAPSFTVAEDMNKSHPQADWNGFCRNVSIYNNLLLDNMEQGIWLVNGRNIKAYNNTIRTGCFTYGQPIFAEFNVGNSEFHNNKFLGCLNSGVGGANSFNNFVHNNIYYSYNQEKDYFSYFDGSTDVGNLAIKQGADYQESHGNAEENNEWKFIGGKLAEEMQDKLNYAETHKTFERKEGSEHTVQGVPKKLLFYSSLMKDFDNYVVEKSIFGKIIGFWKAILIIILSILVILFFYFRKKKQKIWTPPQS